MGLSRASTFAYSRSSYGASPPGNAGSALPPPPAHPATNAPATTTFQAPPQRRPTTKFDSDESDEPQVAPQSLGTVAVAQQSSLPPLSKGEFPDPSNVNRRPPYFGYSEWAGIDTKLDMDSRPVLGARERNLRFQRMLNGQEFAPRWRRM
ncbi:hypothetical protein KEM55_000859 [Ascosphaera atra]|nr:hypothetical protein KEM55_000859 [Ascosphaera atra]